MKYDALLKSGRIRRQAVSEAEIDAALERARRDLRTGRGLLAEDADWSFAVAYNAVLQACRAYMFARGYRPASAEGHKNTFAFMRVAMGRDYEDLIAYFDRVRNKRNQALYDSAGLITGTEARDLLAKAAQFVELIRTQLGRRGPP